MEAEPVPPKPDDTDTPEDTTEEVAETTAPLHFEGKGLDPEIERGHEDG